MYYHVCYYYYIVIIIINVFIIMFIISITMHTFSLFNTFIIVINGVTVFMYSAAWRSVIKFPFNIVIIFLVILLSLSLSLLLCLLFHFLYNHFICLYIPSGDITLLSLLLSLSLLLLEML